MITDVSEELELGNGVSIAPEQWGRSSKDHHLPAWIELRQARDLKAMLKLMVGQGFLTAEMVDTLEASGQDWIVRLNPEQVVEVQEFDGKQPGVKSVEGRATELRVGDWVERVSPVEYRDVEIEGWRSQFAMLSGWVGGWGRVRFVLMSWDGKQPMILVTNRLNWSPRKVLELYLQTYS